MLFSKKDRPHILDGIIFVALFAIVATYIAEFNFFKTLGISPLIIGIVLGIFYANTLSSRLSSNLKNQWSAGITFSTKTLLRTAIVFYGFRLTFENIAEVGLSGIIVSGLIVGLTFIIGYFVGVKVLKLDRDITILTSAGSSICGAAAVLATEPILKSQAYKSTIAVSTVVLFGTISMFLYPYLYHLGILDLTQKGMGVYIGGTLHEVAHVVAAGNTLSEEIAKNAVIVKMIRVMMIAPFLIILGLFLTKTAKNKIQGEKNNIIIPWFAVLFIVVAGFNSLDLLPLNVVKTINNLDTFALTMAMTALGMQTSVDKFKDVGMKPIYLATILFIWLIFGGYFITKFAMNF